MLALPNQRFNSDPKRVRISRYFVNPNSVINIMKVTGRLVLGGLNALRLSSKVTI